MTTKRKETVEEEKASAEDRMWFEPKTVKYIDDKKRVNLFRKYGTITWLLRNGPMTPKEIHEHFKLKDKENQYELSLKTIYRRLDKLEKARLVKQSGMRVRDDARLSEKLYSRTAKVFFVDFGDKKLECEECEKEEMFQMVSEILSIMYGVPQRDQEFIEIAKKLNSTQEDFNKLVFKKTEKNADLEQIFGRRKIETLNKVLKFASVIALLLQEDPDEIKKLRAMFLKDAE